ncbi:hypothetical protein PGT21_023492 [Puccinia graminis f. sp. tritici]|uniref:Secreted protein n=2 Tax=Puccinia graminis f. sp. tritici TaxID=56615 RepID=E3JZJ1_PUCGT|nr:uncharacterized protein PGTG_03422 [Puccinia graminis f. sp. tritici CRL 75-36-700-3]EFP77466.2 hypothetical protein PGTG_03422 [Puccinia graminis f. sp. tritici CRL 75-36-700-3]KAA1110507.1 hypothetical protein PGT21_023492 [Puccinia graminis f. sp. tritici]
MSTRVKNCTIICSAILQLFLPASAMEGAGGLVVISNCLYEGCRKKCHVLPDTLVRQYRFPLEGECGPYFDGQSWKHCHNIRRKIYFRCGTCARLHYTNWTMVRVVTGEDCWIKPHLTLDKVPIKPPELDLIAHFSGQGSSSAGPST